MTKMLSTLVSSSRCLVHINNRTGRTISVAIAGQDTTTLGRGVHIGVEYANTPLQLNFFLPNQPIPAVVTVKSPTGQTIQRATTSYLITACRDIVLTDAGTPLPDDDSRACRSPGLLALARQVNNATSANQDSVLANIRQAVFSGTDINQIICLEEGGTGYLLELAIRRRLPSLVSGILQLGANPNLSSEPTSILSQLLGIQRPHTAEEKRIICTLIQYGAKL